ncbi:MAG TPA: hypothetical protein VHX61_18530 [Rhizomicrobium sp.]|jgi:hypothetical protein|nr:hypothetical protein [Rhizomicrobium sp.]
MGDNAVDFKRHFGEIGRDCGGCLDVEMPTQSFTGERLPAPTARRAISPASSMIWRAAPWTASRRT